jgi:hypothetical protein
MLRALTIGLALLACTVRAGAQTKPPAFLDAEAPKGRVETLHLQAQVAGGGLGADGRGHVQIGVAPKAKMHVYAADVAGYLPFTLKVEPAALVTPGKVTYPAAETYVFPPTGESSRVYLKPFTVTHAFVLTPDARRTVAAGGSVTGTATIRYQACDDRVCYRPATATVAFDITR